MRLTAEQKKQKATRLHEVLVDLKNKCDNGDFRHNNENVRDFFYKNGFTNSGYLTSMNKLNILYRDDFSCNRWKENIPVSLKLAHTIMNKSSELYSKTRKKNQQMRMIENKTTTKMKKQKPTTTKVNNTQTILSYNIPKVGLIRRFLRWLY